MDIVLVSSCHHYLYLKRKASRSGPLTVQKLVDAEAYWVPVAQQSDFGEEILTLRKVKTLPKGKLLPLHPFLDDHGLPRLGGRTKHLGLPFSQCHPIIFHGNHILTKLIIQAEHLWLLHAGSTLVAASLTHRFHILRGHDTICFITCNCVICQRMTGQSRPQIMGQLPANRFSTGFVFDRVGVDYAGLIWIKSGCVRKPVITKTYVALFVPLSVSKGSASRASY